MQPGLGFRLAVLFFVGTLGFALTGCTPPSQTSVPVVSKVETMPVANPPASAYRLADIKAQAALTSGEGPVASLISTPSTDPVIVATVTLKKASLLNRQFLYGADLQYSSISDEGASLIMQSLSTGHMIVYFRIVDDRLQMLADQHLQFESDVDHPERLIHEFPIKSQDADSLVVEFTRASPILNTVLNGAKAPAARTSWLRSAQFVPEGEYMLFETSMELPDGSIAEFMESFFPRERVIPADAKPLIATADVEPLAERYRFLDSGDVYLDVAGKGRTKVKIASRFHRTPGQTIDWWVTPNIPAEYLPEIKSAVEGWNRYSQKMFGQDIVSFKGPLPAGVKLGDPRFNVINWDSISQAGAAYESQASDPATGIESHSLIYLPKAWVNIGKEYWEHGSPSEGFAANTARVRELTARASVFGKSLPVHCMRDALESVSLEARLNPDQFSKELLKGVLFHEMGHAMGLAHNFKGSLSMDPKDPSSAFSTSIMDYNQYQLEKVAFDSLESSTGPLLEYDRQIMSVLYNDGKDVAATDPTVPACSDSESDSEDGGVDPLCIRYDAGHDPTEELASALSLLKDEAANIRGERALSLAIRSLATEFKDASQVKTKDEALAQLEKLTTNLVGIVSYYYTGGAQSLSYMIRANIRSLRQFKAGILPAGYDEKAMRLRAIEGLRYATSVGGFEAPVKQAIEDYKQLVSNWLSSTAYVASVAAENKTNETAALLKGLNAMPAALEKQVLSGVRSRVFADLKASEKAPFYFVDDGATSIDFERESAQALAQAALSASRPLPERVTAAKSLKSFANAAVGAQIATDTAQSLQAQAKTARSLDERSGAVAAWKALTQEDPPPKP